eukprot:6091496-Prymnesium_polylepis.1
MSGGAPGPRVAQPQAGRAPDLSKWAASGCPRRARAVQFDPALREQLSHPYAVLLASSSG